MKLIRRPPGLEGLCCSHIRSDVLFLASGFGNTCLQIRQLDMLICEMKCMVKGNLKLSKELHRTE